LRYYLGLGSNLGDSFAHIRGAESRLRKAGVRIIRCSSVYRTEPVGSVNQPWFLNRVIEIDTDQSPLELLVTVKAIETKRGRCPGPRNGPRPIDIDILLAEGTILRTASLEIPHPRLPERRFALVPLVEIAPDLVHPVFKKSIRSILRRCPDKSQVVRI